MAQWNLLNYENCTLGCTSLVCVPISIKKLNVSWRFVIAINQVTPVFLEVLFCELKIQPIWQKITKLTIIYFYGAPLLHFFYACTTCCVELNSIINFGTSL